jgi:hypothetical protein
MRVSVALPMVEAEDTPSDAITLAILYKLLILQLLPFASVTSSDHPKTASSPQHAPDAASRCKIRCSSFISNNRQTEHLAGATEHWTRGAKPGAVGHL